MSKVICIKKCTQYEGGKPFWVSPEIGEKCTVKGERIKNGKKYLFFYEYDGFAFDARCFAILPDAEPETVTEDETLLQTA